MSLMHEPICREAQIEGIADSIARDCENNDQRIERMARIEKIHGEAMASAIRHRAFQLLKRAGKC